MRKGVASEAVYPWAHFYVEAAHVAKLARVLPGKGVLLLVGPRQSGKSTDSLALLRMLHKSGYQVDLLTAPILTSYQLPLCCTPSRVGAGVRPLRLPLKVGVLQVVYVGLGALVSSPHFDGDNIWSAVLDELDVPVREGRSAFATLENPDELPSLRAALVVVFDEVSSLLTRNGALREFLMHLRSLRHSLSLRHSSSMSNIR